MSKQQALFWYVHAKAGSRDVCLAVAAFTERSAKRQARIALGPVACIGEANAVEYAHAWVIDHGLKARQA